MTTVHIPATADNAVAELTNLGRLINAREWERAAIVAALVGPAAGHGPGRGKGSTSAVYLPILGENGLVAKKIVGLGSQHTIERYRDAWFDAGLPTPRLGSNVDLPDLPWPPDETHRRLDNGPRRAAVEAEADRLGVSRGAALRAAESSAKAMAAAMADPETAKQFAEAVEESDTATLELAKAQNQTPRAVERHKQVTRTAKADEAREAEAVYHLRGFRVLPTMWACEDLAEYIENKVARTREDEDYARNAGLWLQSIGKRIVAWADGETVELSEEDFAQEIGRLLGETA